LHITFHSLASEAPARLRLLEQDDLAPGGEAWAQVRLYRPLALLKGDRFIIRDANDTLGGGTIIETQARRHPRGRESVIAALERQRGGDPAEAVYAAIAAGEPAELGSAIARTDLGADEAAAAVGRLIAAGRIVVLGEAGGRYAYTATTFDRLDATALAAVSAHLKEHPLRRGLGREELRSRLNVPPRLFGPVLAAIVGRGELVDAGAVVAPRGWQPALTTRQRSDADAFVAALRPNPFSPTTDLRPAEELVAYLVDAGEVVDCDGTAFTAEAFEAMTARVLELGQSKGTFTIGEVRDLLGTSRRYVQPFLEELDRRRVTVRRGDERYLRG
jgi:selenocysteine-specific elongation factor